MDLGYTTLKVGVLIQIHQLLKSCCNFGQLAISVGSTTALTHLCAPLIGTHTVHMAGKRHDGGPSARELGIALGSYAGDRHKHWYVCAERCFWAHATRLIAAQRGFIPA